jgi:hypothetical protein
VGLADGTFVRVTTFAGDAVIVIAVGVLSPTAVKASVSEAVKPLGVEAMLSTADATALASPELKSVTI